MRDAIIEALREAGATERSVPASSYKGAEPVGMFRVRRNVTIGEMLRKIMDAVLGTDKVIDVDGIRVRRPREIAIRMIEMRRWEFTPNFPVDATLLGMDVSVDLSSVELVRDDETGHPAILLTTASSMKPDVMLVCDVGEKPSEDQTIPEVRRKAVERLIQQMDVPQKYQLDVHRSVGVAYTSGIAQRAMASSGIPATGPVKMEDSDRVAKQIVVALKEDGVVQGGILFWFQLGYWLVRIISLLIRSERV